MFLLGFMSLKLRWTFDLQEYDELLHTCEDRLRSVGVPLRGFRSSEQILNTATPRD